MGDAPAIARSPDERNLLGLFLQGRAILERLETGCSDRAARGRVVRRFAAAARLDRARVRLALELRNASEAERARIWKALGFELASDAETGEELP